MPRDCSVEASVISAMMWVTRCTEATISCMVSPATRTCCAPLSTLLEDCSIRSFTSRAAWALRWASVRTSPATTAKPLPCSPARAASTAAFKARILVWKAMPSITETISAMRRELSEIRAMVSTTWPTATPPRSATPRLSAARPLAWCACSVFCLTAVASSSMEAAVSSSEAACSSVRDDRLVLPEAISAAPVLISVTLRRTSATVRVRLSCMRLSAVNRTPISLSEFTATRWVRSPDAMRSKCRAASFSGCSTWRLMKRQQPSARTAARASMMMVDSSARS